MCGAVGLRQQVREGGLAARLLRLDVVPALDEVARDIAGRRAPHAPGHVVPGHAGRARPLHRVLEGRVHLHHVLEDEVAVVLAHPQLARALQASSRHPRARVRRLLVHRAARVQGLVAAGRQPPQTLLELTDAAQLVEDGQLPAVAVQEPQRLVVRLQRVLQLFEGLEVQMAAICSV